MFDILYCKVKHKFSPRVDNECICDALVHLGTWQTFFKITFSWTRARMGYNEADIKAVASERVQQDYFAQG